MQIASIFVRQSFVCRLLLRRVHCSVCVLCVYTTCVCVYVYVCVCVCVCVLYAYIYVHETYISMRLDLRYMHSRQKLFITAFR
jgi:hypothetical protein